MGPRGLFPGIIVPGIIIPVLGYLSLHPISALDYVIHPNWQIVPGNLFPA